MWDFLPLEACEIVTIDMQILFDYKDANFAWEWVMYLLDWEGVEKEIIDNWIFNDDCWRQYSQYKDFEFEDLVSKLCTLIFLGENWHTINGYWEAYS